MTITRTGILTTTEIRTITGTMTGTGIITMQVNLTSRLMTMIVGVNSAINSMATIMTIARPSKQFHRIIQKRYQRGGKAGPPPPQNDEGHRAERPRRSGTPRRSINSPRKTHTPAKTGNRLRHTNKASHYWQQLTLLIHIRPQFKHRYKQTANIVIRQTHLHNHNLHTHATCRNVIYIQINIQTQDV